MHSRIVRMCYRKEDVTDFGAAKSGNSIDAMLQKLHVQWLNR